MSLDYPFAASPIPGETEEIIPGIFWLRMPLPFSLNHINLWLIAEEDGYAIVDTGLGDDTTRDLWLKILGSRRLTRVLVTHHHSDHMGAATWLTEHYGARMWTTHTEWLVGRAMSLVGDTETTATATSFYAAAGLADDVLAMLPARLNLYSRATCPVTPVFRRLRHGDEIVLGDRRWRVIVGEGHTSELMTLYCPESKVLITGDQILPKISPNISVWPNEPDGDPLGQYLATFDRFRGLPEDTLVLPSHGMPFRGLRCRIEEIECHHQNRLDRTLERCARPVTAAELVPAMFRRELDDFEIFLAVGEAMAHLHCLIGRGVVERDESSADLRRYRRV